MEYKILLCHLFDDANNMKGMHEILELALAICPCSRTILSISWPVGYWRNDVLKMGPMWRTLCFLAVNKSLFPIITYQSKKVTLPISGLNGLHFRHLIISISKAKSWDGGPPLWRVFSYSPWESNFRGHFRAEGQRKISFWGWCQSIFMASRPFLFYSMFYCCTRLDVTCISKGCRQIVSRFKDCNLWQGPSTYFIPLFKDRTGFFRI